MNVFAISRKSFSIVEFDSTGLRRLRKYFASRIKKCKRLVIRVISTRLLYSSGYIQNYDDGIPAKQKIATSFFFPDLSEITSSIEFDISGKLAVAITR